MISCPCVVRHVPAIRSTVTHHTVPKSWGGPDTPDNRIELCDNAHRLVHHRLNQWRTYRAEPPASGFSTFIRDLARRGWEGADHTRPLPRTSAVPSH